MLRRAEVILAWLPILAHSMVDLCRSWSLRHRELLAEEQALGIRVKNRRLM